ncbi:MAG: prepilin-type N-terminal cleavage/methylation domain-containing protein [Acidobacteriota bacterium]|nr:prepilin-type N-terminal cleavage/methylation domain-containing protein [Acidobacteriota bacterium]
MRTHAREQSGFTLVEALVAMGVTVVGVLSLAAALAFGTRMLLGSQGQIVASQRAAEAIEAVFKARDSRVIAWSLIRNEEGESGSDNGIFLDGPRDIREPGDDGLINTDDDGDIEEVIRPGVDGLMGTADDERTPLSNYSREIEIRDIGPNLRRIRVIVRYRSDGAQREYVLTTFVSAYA